MPSRSNIVLITGASRGIRAAIARLAAVEGHDVAVNYLSNWASADAVVADVERAGRRGMAVQGDVALEGDVERLFAARFFAEATLGSDPAKARAEACAKAATTVGNVIETYIAAQEKVARPSTLKPLRLYLH
jgi:hypothetical protein